MSFFAELQRRHVYKVGAAYCVAGWLLVQIVTQVFPIYDISARVQRIIVGLIIAGLPVALVLAWLFDLTPQGIVRTPDLAPAGEAGAVIERYRSTDRKLNYLLGLLLVAALSVVAYDHAHAHSGDGEPTKPSIAVLPLINEGGDASNEYFSDGLSEELIAALAQIGEMKVIGRSSSFRFRGSNEDSRSIGEKLGVNTLLEGTVRRQGDRVRIVAELIHAADGRELWSRTFDRELKDIFAVQAEIAAAVADSLKLTLLGGNAKTNGQTTSVEAHNAFLQAHFLSARLNRDDYYKAVDYYDEAIRLDPNYALAYAERAEASSWLADWTPEPGRVAVARASALADARKAVDLAPDLVDAHAALGWVLFFSDWKFQEGLAELLHAQQLAPNDAVVNELLSRVLLYMGRGQEAERVARHSIEIDPLTFKAHENLARILFAQGRLQESDAEGRKAAELQPTAVASRRWQVFAALLLHDDATALAEAGAEPAPGYHRFEMALVLAKSPDRAAADAAMKDLVNRGAGLEYQIAEVYAWRGDVDQACEWLQKAYANHDTGLLSSPFDPFLKPLHGDARYEALRAQLGLPDPAW